MGFNQYGGAPVSFTEMCSGSKAGSYLRLTYWCITQLKAQGPSRTCNESKEEEEESPVSWAMRLRLLSLYARFASAPPRTGVPRE